MPDRKGMVYELAYCFINVSRMTMDGITGGLI